MPNGVIEKGVEHYAEELNAEEIVTHWWKLNADGSVTAEMYLPQVDQGEASRIWV